MKPLPVTNKKNATFVVVTLTSFLLLAFTFLIIAGKYNKNVFKIKREIRRLIELKLSSDDLVDLNNRTGNKWINVRLIETNKKKFYIKIRPLATSVSHLDFQLNIDGTVYNLFKLNGDREKIYKYFKEVDNWGLDRSSPLVIRLKINGVLIGVYIMEPFVYEQLRDTKGNYFIRLNTDTHRLRTIRYEAEHGITRSLEKYFHARQLATYFIFFSLFNYDRPPDPAPLVLYFDSTKKKHSPYLTMESLIYSLEVTQRRSSTSSDALRSKPFSAGLKKAPALNLLKKSRTGKYAPLITMVLEKAGFGLNETP
ncbi:MAG: hypothetical protein GY765_41230 [bacterium]|nr:hypothetical protein [bacterium]